MKRFIKTLLGFVLIIICIIIGFDVLSSRIVNKFADFKLSKQTLHIILGHSHPECAYNDSLINNISNLSKSGESYFYTYQKIKPLLEQNPQIKTVFIEFTNNQLMAEMNQWIWGDKFLSEFYPLYSSFIRTSDQSVLMKNNYKGFLIAYSLALKKRISILGTKQFDYSRQTGGYLYLERDKTDSLLLALKKFGSPTPDTNISYKNIEYLAKTIHICQQNKKRVILVRSPLHPKYYGYFNERKYKEFLKNKFAGIEYLDFSKFPAADDEFGDLEHLNHKGARIFSIWFNTLLKNKLLDQKDQQRFVDSALCLPRTPI